jgi:hypothetical protein
VVLVAGPTAIDRAGADLGAAFLRLDVTAVAVAAISVRESTVVLRRDPA